MELPNSSKFKLSDHFVERWNERKPDDWNRFVWILENTFYHLLCTDHLGRSHCLHYNPNSKEWFVFITDKRNKLITILPTEYYIRMGNSVNLSGHYEQALEFLRANHVVTKLNSDMELCFRIHDRTSPKFIHVIRVPLNLGKIWKGNDLYPLHVDFESNIEKIVYSDYFISEVSKTIPSDIGIIGSWLRIIGRTVALDIQFE